LLAQMLLGYDLVLSL